MISRRVAVAASLALLAACSPETTSAPRGLSETTTTVAPVTTVASTSTTTTTTTRAPTTTTTTIPRFPAMGTVVDAAGLPLAGATVAAGATVDVTDENGEFFFDAVPADVIVVTRPGWLRTSVDWVEGGVF